MATPSKTETAPSAEEERLANALIGRGLLTREEYQQCRSTAEAAAGTDALLKRLVKAGLLTLAQARRARQELAQPPRQEPAQSPDIQIPGYEMGDKLGQGAMGVVYKARQKSMDRLVAIKLLHARLAANAEFIERFQREAHLAAKFSSNNVVQAIDVGSAGPLHYFVMELVEGTTIKQELEKGKVYQEREAVDIVLQVAQALQQAHRRGLIHRDVKPANIVLTAEGIAKLADLGMARDTADRELAKEEKGMAIGTPYYMAPEQIEGRMDVDSRADIYSLGATFYHMVTGQPPFPGTKGKEVMQAHLDQELTPPDHLNTNLSSGLGEVVECTMAKDRDQRYQTPADLIVDLECLLNGEPPRLARQQMNVSALKGLAHGAAEEDEDEDDEPPAAGVPLLWVYVGGAVLGVSLLLNLILLLR
jgi:serine/threonine-protein kinase